MQHEVPATPIDYIDDTAGAQGAPVDLLAVALGALRRWKLIAAVTLCSLIATYGLLKFLPSLYKSTVEILVYDPQQQIDTAIQKPVSPFVDAIGDEAMSTELNILKSKSVALRVARELHLDKDPEFEPQQVISWKDRLGIPGGSGGNDGRTAAEKAEALDQAADALLDRIQVSQDSYIIRVSVSSQSPIKAQRLAQTIATDYLASQREARQQALERVAVWLKGRVDNLQSRVLETESNIEKLKADSHISEDDFNNTREEVGGLYAQLMKAREDVEEKRARLDQASHVVETNGDTQSIPELTASGALTQLRREQSELSSRATDLQNRLGANHIAVVTIRQQLAAVNNQISAEANHILGDLKNAYDIAVRQQQALEANLQTLTSHVNSETYTKLQQLRRVADADRKLYESYLSQYNDISERATVQDASSRIISPATLPRSTTSARRKLLLFPLGGMAGLGGGLMLACLLEYLRPVIKTGAEIEQIFGRPVMGIIPLVGHRKTRSLPGERLLGEVVDEPFSHLTEAVHAVRISLELSNVNPKVILITSALPAEGKSTVAMLLAASAASSGKKTILLDCDLRQPSTSAALQNAQQAGLSDLLLGTAKLADVITKDPITNIYVIPAGSMVPNAPDWLKSQRMVDLITELRSAFDYVVMDTSPLLPVVDALVLTTVADKVLVVVEWSRTPRDSIAEAFKVLRPEAHRVAGIVLNKADGSRLPGYGYAGYNYRSVGKHLASHEI